MENTNIAWTNHTFNAWIGCTKVSAGCAHCYAETLNMRCGQKNWGPGAERRVTSDANWRKPMKWDREAAARGTRWKVFCASMADVFDADAPTEARTRLFELIKKTPNLDWQILTKRPENFQSFLPADWGQGYPNVWLGVTVENRATLQHRVPLLKAVHARVKFLSCEPLLESIVELDLTGIDWVIVGGESGGNARAFETEWMLEVVTLCAVYEVAVFVKQLGANPFYAGDPLRIVNAHGRRDRHAGDPEFWPADVRSIAFRQFPGQVA